MEIPVPTKARISKDKVGELTPIDAFYTAGYGCVTGERTLMGPTMTYKFSGKDLELNFDVLVRTANGFTNFRYTADRIWSEKVKRYPTTLEGDNEFIVYELEQLPKDLQARIFEAMKVNWEIEGLTDGLIRHLRR